MKALSLPFKLTVSPAKFALGFVGVCFATAFNVGLTMLLIAWGQGNVGFMHGVYNPAIAGLSMSVILQFSAFCLSLYAAYGSGD